MMFIDVMLIIIMLIMRIYANDANSVTKTFVLFVYIGVNDSLSPPTPETEAVQGVIAEPV